MTALDDLVSLLDGVTERRDRLAALELVEAAGEEAPWLQRRAHLIARGGATTLVREALWEPPASALRRWAEAHLARHPDRGPMLRPVATTRGRRGAVRTFETGLHIIGDARFAPDGETIFAFAWGALRGELARRFGELDGSLLLTLSLRTGAVEQVRRAGQFREENGALAIALDGTHAAVRSHRSTLIVDLASGRPVRELRGCEGPYDLRFVDDRHLLVLDSSTLELWDYDTGIKIQSVDTVGHHGFALSPDRSTVAVTGAGTWAAFGLHALPSLALIQKAALDRGRAPSAIAFHPGGRLLGTGDWDHRVRLWPLPGGQPRNLGKHRGWVSAARFVDRGRLLVTGGWDAQLMAWDVGSGERCHVLSGHSSYVTALDVHPDGDHVLSCAADGDIRVWRASDLEDNAEPPYAFPYGGHWPEVAAGVRGDRFVVRAGDHALAWSPDGACLGAVEARFPAGPEVRFHGGHISIATGGEDEPRVLRVLDATTDRVLDEAQLDADVLAMAALDDRLATLDQDGHMTFWRVAPPFTR